MPALATMSEDVELATTSFAKSVNKALSELKLAEARSKMPSTLRDWAGAPLITIRFDRPPGDQLETRLATFVTEVVNRPANRPLRAALLLQALERAVGQVAIHILKPNEGFALIRVSVTELSSQTFSNRQRSTVATALMLMLSELRRQSRGSAKLLLEAGVISLLQRRTRIVRIAEKLYSEALGRLQGHLPPSAYLIGRTWHPELSSTMTTSTRTRLRSQAANSRSSNASMPSRWLSIGMTIVKSAVGVASATILMSVPEPGAVPFSNG
jgi:hypothetical protein